MSGITPPSIINYEWTVRDSDSSFLNVSFPFRVKIESIWFTTQQNYGVTAGLWQGVDETVDIETTERKLSLAVIKSKNSKTQHSQYDNPTDLVWGFEDVSTYNGSINEDLKPTMWLGNPDDAAGRIGAFASSSWFGGNASSLRSTAVAPVDKGTAFNASWGNETQYDARKYATDVAVMNTDEFLQMFVYANGGDWTGYEDDATVTISVAYTGMSNDGGVSASAKPWTAWWND
jgi:hypothetical protein